MTGPVLPPSIETELARTRRAQGEAADPAASVWVSANAGTGKTHVLAMRVLRLMLAGTPPERILCLTYTKAAAAEMSERVFGELATWVTMERKGLDAKLAELNGRAPTADEAARARTLFTTAIETPGGLKVQTIHAFAERLLQRFPLEAGVTPGFAILDEESGHALVREAIDDVLGAAARPGAGALGEALRTAVAHAGDERFDELLAEALRFRDWLACDAEAAGRQLRATLGVREGIAREAIEREMAEVLTTASLVGLGTILAAGSRRDAELADRLAAAAAAAHPSGRIAALRSALLTEKGEPRKALMTNGIAAANPGAAAELQAAQQRFLALDMERCGLLVAEATAALAVLARAVLDRYGDAKVRRAALDFDDLIDKTKTLLTARGAAEWVLFKLDAGIDHILVDESQDTSPGQWEVVAALTEEFFSGASARAEPRTLFAVGDEKQSIYSFQGAAPHMFAEMGRRFAGMAGEAGHAWRPIRLDVSFRSVAPVLKAVDCVFGDAARTPGVMEPGRDMRHIASRAGHGGLVEIWPTETHAPPVPLDVWSPLDEAASPLPATRLAERIADTIKGWLVSREPLPSAGRPIRPGDILVLVRKRQPFAAVMVAALKARDIAVAGADRLRLAEQIAVQDLVSLGNFLTLPEDDLALAEVLKSPIFGFDDDDLLTLAHGRKGTLWKALLDATGTKPRTAEAAATLKRWRREADFAPPYEFYARILDGEGVRAKLISRLGPDAADPIDEFQNLALTYDDHATPSLTGFLTWLSAEEREIKRDMEHGRDEVRVMTVHGAKGLEAPIVFLPDTCGAANGGRRTGTLLGVKMSLPHGRGADAFLWPVKGTSRHAAVRAAKRAVEDEERAEHERLLYVAMTRARDRLYVAGFENRNGRGARCWYDLIAERLDGMLEDAEGPGGLKVRRLSSPQTAAPEADKTQPRADAAAGPLPAWMARPAPREPQLTVPLAPSRLAPYDTDETGEPLPCEPAKPHLAEPLPVPPTAGRGEDRFLRGTLTHALLEHLSGLDRAAWPDAARLFVAKLGARLPAAVQAGIVAEVLAVLDDPAFAPLFGPGGRAEVPIAAVIPRPKGSGPALRIAGQIDRLVELEREVLIIDYKTNRTAPREPAGVAPVYLYQLAAYRLAVGEVFRGKAVRAALLWTDGPTLMEIPASMLDGYAARLWDLDPALLDA